MSRIIKFQPTTAAQTVIHYLLAQNYYTFIPINRLQQLPVSTSTYTIF